MNKEKNNNFTKRQALSQGSDSQLEGAPIGQIWENWGTKKTVINYKSLRKNKKLWVYTNNKYINRGGEEIFLLL